LHEFQVRLEERSYPIIIASNVLAKTGDLIRSVTGAARVMLVSNPTVFRFYGPVVIDALQSSGFEVVVALMPDGEEYKNMEEAAKILDRAVKVQLERSSVLVALGGGVVGDLAGFVASIYQRGIDFIQIPTTLLAQVDSSVGGKVAVNHPGGKNLIGSFHQPCMVIIDSRTLATLEDREYFSGLGEVVKYGIIYDEDFFSFIEENAVKIRNKDEACIEKLIYQSCKIKSGIVEQDEKEMGIRSILNLGHTFGHSIEKLGNFSEYRHGEAVVMGTMAAAFLSLDIGLITMEQLQRIIDLYKKLGLSIQFPAFDPNNVYQGMLNDKKVLNKKLRLVLPKGIGNYAIVEDTSKEQVIAAIQRAQNI